MRKFAANIAFTGTKHIQNPLIITSDDGEILSVTEKKFDSQEIAGLEYYSGMIIPGLINAHTHIELSVPNHCYQAKGGILDFVQHVIRLRRNNAMPDEKSIAKTLRQMQFQGIRAFADIANSTISFPAKNANKQIASKSFFEFFPLSSEQADQQADVFMHCKTKFPEADIFPAFHSPYAISLAGLTVIQQHFEKTALSSVHFRESEFETTLHAENNPLNRFYRNMNPDFKPAFENPDFSNGQGKILENTQQLLLVHNIHITEQEILNLKKWSENQRVKLNFVLCPRSNDNIAGILPPLDLLMEHRLNICLGTDSLLSAPNLSIFDEMKFLQQKFPALRLQDMLKMASFNAANALGWSEDFGEIAVGKCPGLNLIEMKQLKRDVLHPEAQLKVLI
ncbi:MAG: amidohydrolase family protein [Bacteroidales bacterium]|jgi:cytosine/adenosine deaminase-related metal-dependent hydrolase|nr:amidohydrolase family protein [Bacteroidales bacterium]